MKTDVLLEQVVGCNQQNDSEKCATCARLSLCEQRSFEELNHWITATKERVLRDAFQRILAMGGIELSCQIGQERRQPVFLFNRERADPDSLVALVHELEEVNSSPEDAMHAILLLCFLANGLYLVGYSA